MKYLPNCHSFKVCDVILYDIYISHCPTDHSTALQVEEFLQENKGLKIFHDTQELNENESWQDDIYDTMVKCSRIVTLLSPGYLASESCIEQYNIALCISRRKHKEVLAPFYVVSVEYLPTYMGLMQYIDCRYVIHQRVCCLTTCLNSSADSFTVRTEVSVIEGGREGGREGGSSGGSRVFQNGVQIGE
jgi:hypothetical protein